MVDSLRPIPRGALADEVYDAVRKAITVGELAPGQRLLELDLAERFGTSQAPVREALGRLAQEGLVTTLPRRGSYVNQPSLAQIAEVYSLRAELESWAVRQLVARATELDLGVLKDLLATMLDAAAAGDRDAFVEADVQFHLAICRASGSEVLLPLWRALDGRVRGTMVVANLITDLTLVSAAEMHPPILAALLARDAPTAERLVREHMEGTLGVVRTLSPEQLEARTGEARAPNMAEPSGRPS